MNELSRASKHWITWVVAGIALAIVTALFLGIKYVPTDALDRMSGYLPLPLFTFVIAIVDGFNPCNLFVLTLLLGFLVSASSSRGRIYLVGYTFVIVVAIFYFLFMAAWLNIFKYIGFVTPLRVAIAIIALVAGIINCKELFFFKKGISLTIQDRHKGPLYRKARKMQEIIVSEKIPALIVASAMLAIFSSLVELPCTAGFPIIYTGVLTGKYVDGSVNYYMYLVLYNVTYVLPLIITIGIMGFILRSRNVTQHEVQVVKFIGGFIMVILGIVLLVKPGLIMAG